jgi:cold shock protein
MWNTQPSFSSHRAKQMNEPTIQFKRPGPKAVDRLEMASQPLNENDKNLGVKTGVVKMFDEKTGFGFIFDSDNHEYFIHYSGIKTKSRFANLAKGQHVKFTGYEGDKGLYARAVSVINV